MPFGTATLISYTTNTSAYKGSKTTKTTEAKKSSQISQSTVAKQIHKNVARSSQQSHSEVTKSSQQSRSDVTSSSQESHQGLNITTTTYQTVKKEEVSTSSFIQEGIRQIQRLTAEASGSSHEETKMVGKQTQCGATSETSNRSNCTFTAVDVEMCGSLGDQGCYSVTL